MCICICIRMFMYTYTYTISPAKLISEQGIQDCLRMYIQQWWTTSMCNLTVFFLQLCAHEPWWPWCASSDFQHDFPSHGYMAWSWTSMTKMRPANLFGRGIKVFNACFGNLYDPVAVLQHVARELLSEGGLVVRFSDFFDFWVQLGGAISCCNPWRCSFSTGSFFLCIRYHRSSAILWVEHGCELYRKKIHRWQTPQDNRFLGPVPIRVSHCQICQDSMGWSKGWYP